MFLSVRATRYCSSGSMATLFTEVPTMGPWPFLLGAGHSRIYQRKKQTNESSAHDLKHEGQRCLPLTALDTNKQKVAGIHRHSSVIIWHNKPWHPWSVWTHWERLPVSVGAPASGAMGHWWVNPENAYCTEYSTALLDQINHHANHLTHTHWRHLLTLNPSSVGFYLYLRRTDNV